MKKYLIPLTLALLSIVCAVLEGLIEGLPAQFVQFNGLLIILCTAAVIAWTLKAEAGKLGKTRSRGLGRSR